MDASKISAVTKCPLGTTSVLVGCATLSVASAVDFSRINSLFEFILLKIASFARGSQALRPPYAKE